MTALIAPTTSTQRSMRSNQPGRTSTEVKILAGVRATGLRPVVAPKLALQSINVRPDMAFRRRRIAVFVHGCFWHACPRHASWPNRNGAWWRAKLEGNARRDARQRRALRQRGWSVLTVWEHEKPARAVARILRAWSQD